MSSCLNTLDELHGWEADLEVEALPSVRSATIIPVLVYVPWFIHNPLTTVIAPQWEQAAQATA